MRYITLFLLAVLAGCYKPESKSFPLGHEKNPLIMAFVPSTEAEKVVSSGEELVALLSDKTGLHFKTHIAPSYVGIVEAMAVGKIHIGWLPPMAYVFAHERNGDQVVLKVVRNGKATYRGQIVVRADSEIQSIADLAGKTIGFTDQTSASGHYYPAALLMENGLDPGVDTEVVYSGSHDAAVIALVKGSVDAACCYEDAREKLVSSGFEDIMTTTRILAYTPEIPSDNVTSAAGLDHALTSTIVNGLLDLAKEEEGSRILMELYEIEGLVPAQDSDYDPVRQMVELMNMDVEEEVNRGS